jgi:hypothetical protein
MSDTTCPQDNEPIGLPKALADLAKEHGGRRALATRLGFTVDTVHRWLRGEKLPGVEASLALAALCPNLRTMLEERGCFHERRKPAPVRRGAETTEQSTRRIAAARAEAAENARATAKAERRGLVALLAASRKEQAKAKRRKASTYVQAMVPAYPSRVSRSGDFTEQLDEITLSEAHCTPIYETEGLR